MYVRLGERSKISPNVSNCISSEAKHLNCIMYLLLGHYFSRLLMEICFSELRNSCKKCFRLSDIK